MNSSYIIDGGKNITVLHDGQMYTISASHNNHSKIVTLLKIGDFGNAVDLIDLRAGVKAWIRAHSVVRMEGDCLAIGDTTFSTRVSEKALNMIDNGNDPNALVLFLQRVIQNPSRTAQQELLLFCEANKFMINSDGHIVAYRSIREDYTDHHTKTIDNSPGQRPEMPRSEVDDDRRNACSYGYHFSAYDYARNFHYGNSRLVVVTVDPADVVAIPPDYGNQKARCCRYHVIAELPNGLPLPDKEVYSEEDLIRQKLGLSFAE